MPFACTQYNIEIPWEEQKSFCAIQHRKGRDFCITCDHGKEAATKEREEMAICKKTCDVCNKQFQGGPRARTCKECREALPGTKDKKESKKSGTKKAVVKVNRSNGSPVGPEAEKVIETLIAIGAVTEKQVAATRKYIQEMSH